MRRLVVTTIVEPYEESTIYENLIETFKMSSAEIHTLNNGTELSVVESETVDGRVITKVRIEEMK